MSREVISRCAGDPLGRRQCHGPVSRAVFSLHTTDRGGRHVIYVGSCFLHAPDWVTVLSSYLRDRTWLVAAEDGDALTAVELSPVIPSGVELRELVRA